MYLLVIHSYEHGQITADFNSPTNAMRAFRRRSQRVGIDLSSLTLWHDQGDSTRLIAHCED